MGEELAFLRAIAANPYDDAIRGAYADWLDEHGRGEEAARIRVTFLRPNLQPANWMTNAELIGKLLGFPLDAGVIYTACSDYSTLRPDEVTLIRAEDRAVVFREQQGFLSYNAAWYEDSAPEHVKRHIEARRQ
jgi:uncharacterized protein (TIGR02996 family)